MHANRDEERGQPQISPLLFAGTGGRRRFGGLRGWGCGGVTFQASTQATQETRDHVFNQQHTVIGATSAEEDFAKL